MSVCLAVTACGSGSDGRYGSSGGAPGLVRGELVTDPTCPVEGVAGQDCAPSPAEGEVDVFAGGADPGNPASEPIASVETDDSGRFELELDPGEYLLVPAPVDAGAVGRPEPVTVTAGDTTEVTVTIDSGIR